MYALIQVAPCKITQENIQIAHTQFTLHQRSLRNFVNALMGRAKTIVLRYSFCRCITFFYCTHCSYKHVRLDHYSRTVFNKTGKLKTTLSKQPIGKRIRC